MRRRRFLNESRLRRRLHESSWGGSSYGNVTPNFVKHLNVAVAEEIDWDYCPLKDVDDIICIVPLHSRRSMLQTGDIEYRDIEDCETLGEAVDYIKSQARCKNVYALERYEHSLVRYSLLELGQKKSDEWDSSIEALVYSPKDEASKNFIASFVEEELTDWANGTNQWYVKLYSVDSDRLESEFRNDFDDNEEVEAIGMYCNLWKDSEFASEVQSCVGKCDYIIKVHYGNRISKGEVMDGKGKSVRI